MNHSRSTLFISAVVLGCLLGGVGATPALASSPTTVSLKVGAAVDDHKRELPVSIRDSTPVAPAPTPSRGGAAEREIPIGPIVSFLKSAGSAIWNACVRAVRAGFSKFKTWWNSLAGWIRTGISWIVDVGLQTLWNWLWNWITGK